MHRIKQISFLLLTLFTPLAGEVVEVVMPIQADCDRTVECCETSQDRGLMDQDFAKEHNLWGIWLPEAPPLFRPFIADPRQVTYSVAWRFEHYKYKNSDSSSYSSNDYSSDGLRDKDNFIPVSYGDILPVFRWVDIWQPGGQLEFGIEGALWAIFDPLHESSPLIDADYYVGFPLVYSCGNWAFKIRGYHISTHIGDEFLLNHPKFDRRNPSIEAFDFYVSNQFSRDLRLYGGIGWVACQDDSFRVGRLYLQGGFEWRYFNWGYQDNCNRLYGVPFLALDLYYQSHFKDRINTTVALGYEWGKESGLERRFRIFLEYHNGYAVEGQFSKSNAYYYALRTTYGF